MMRFFPMPDSPTAQLQGWIERLNQGDESALNEMLVEYHERFVILAHKMLRGFPRVRRLEETGDVLNEAEMKLIRALRAMTRDGRIRHDGTFHLVDFFRLAGKQMRRTLLDMARKCSGVRANVVSIDDAQPTDEPSDGGTYNPVRLAEWTEFHRQADALDEPLRAVFDLVYYGGFNLVRTGAMLGLCDDTVRKRYREARLALADRLGGRLPGR
jgi:RNA polymerase sigma factor (sigma-70 family)